jgi:hypothetical protein
MNTENADFKKFNTKGTKVTKFFLNIRVDPR